mgnify:CR=1 FL=1
MSVCTTESYRTRGLCYALCIFRDGLFRCHKRITLRHEFHKLIESPRALHDFARFIHHHGRNAISLKHLFHRAILSLFGLLHVRPQHYESCAFALFVGLYSPLPNRKAFFPFDDAKLGCIYFLKKHFFIFVFRFNNYYVNISYLVHVLYKYDKKILFLVNKEQYKCIFVVKKY